MSVYIKFAETASERDGLFRIRHRVFVEQGAYMLPCPDQRIYDRFDTFPTTTNVIAIVDDKVVGGVRLAEPSSAGNPADEYFDFTPYLPRTATRVGSASMLCLDQQYHHQRRFMSCLAGMFYYLATQRRLSHIVAPVNPEIESALRATGYRRVAPVFEHTTGVAVVPMVLALDAINDRFVQFIRKHDNAPGLHSFARLFCAQGETVISAGEPATAAYVVVAGSACVETQAHGHPPQRTRIGPGDMFGELSLLTRRPYNITVVAATDLDLIVIDAPAFRRQIRATPECAMAL